MTITSSPLLEQPRAAASGRPLWVRVETDAIAIVSEFTLYRRPRRALAEATADIVGWLNNDMVAKRALTNEQMEFLSGSARRIQPLCLGLGLIMRRS